MFILERIRRDLGVAKYNWDDSKGMLRSRFGTMNQGDVSSTIKPHFRFSKLPANVNSKTEENILFGAVFSDR